MSEARQSSANINILLTFVWPKKGYNVAQKGPQIGPFISKDCCMNYVVCVKRTLFPVQMTHPQKATGCCYDYDDDCDDDNDDVEDNVWWIWKV